MVRDSTGRPRSDGGGPGSRPYEAGPGFARTRARSALRRRTSPIWSLPSMSASRASSARNWKTSSGSSRSPPRREPAAELESRESDERERGAARRVHVVLPHGIGTQRPVEVALEPLAVLRRRECQLGASVFDVRGAISWLGSGGFGEDELIADEVQDQLGPLEQRRVGEVVRHRAVAVHIEVVRERIGELRVGRHRPIHRRLIHRRRGQQATEPGGARGDRGQAGEVPRGCGRRGRRPCEHRQIAVVGPAEELPAGGGESAQDEPDGTVQREVHDQRSVRQVDDRQQVLVELASDSGPTSIARAFRRLSTISGRHSVYQRSIWRPGQSVAIVRRAAAVRLRTDGTARTSTGISQAGGVGISRSPNGTTRM